MARASFSSRALAVAALALLGLLSSEARAEHQILFEFPYQGFRAVATNQSINYWLNNSPGSSYNVYRTNAAGTWMPTGIQNAVAGWNVGRPWITYLQQSSVCCPSGGYWPQPIWFQHDPMWAGNRTWRWPVPCDRDLPENRESCYAFIGTNEADDFPLTAYESFTGSIVHEIGHGLAGLKHPANLGDCSTVMSGCWRNLNSPTEHDQIAAHRVYGIPDGVAASWFIDRPFVCWYDRSSYEYQFKVGESVLSGGQWVSLGTFYVGPSAGSNGLVCFSDAVSRPPGSYLFSVIGRNTYPTNPPVNGDQFGNFGFVTYP